MAKLAVVGCFVTASWLQAAEVPPGVKLAPVQQLVRGNRAEVTSLDPHLVEGLPEVNVISDLLEGLVNFGIKGEIVSGVAKSWHSSDQQHWIFSLRSEARWSNGDPVTADDFVYAWQRLADPKTASPYLSHLQYLKIAHIDEIISGHKPPEALGIKAIDQHTLQISLSQPVSYLVKMLAHIALKPVHRATVEKYQAAWTSPEHYVGNGAYRLQAWVVNEQITLVRNEHYWDNRNTVVNQVKYLPIDSTMIELTRYRSGEIDMIYDSVPMEHLQQVTRELPGEVHRIPVLAVHFYELNNQQPPFNDVRVRKALALAVDRDTIVNKVKNQGEIAAYQYTPTITDGFSAKAPEWALWSQQKRRQAAQELLRQAGYSKQQPLRFTLLHDTSETYKKLAVAVSAMWREAIGAEITLESQEWKTFLSSRRLGNFQMARASWVGDYNEPSVFLNTLLSNSSNNRCRYRSLAFDTLLTKALTATSEEARQLLYQQAEDQLQTDMPLIPVYYFASARLIKPHVGGYSEQNPMNIFYTKDLYIKQH